MVNLSCFIYDTRHEILMCQDHNLQSQLLLPIYAIYNAIDKKDACRFFLSLHFFLGDTQQIKRDKTNV